METARDVACCGAGDITVVALHGIQGTRASWQPLKDALSYEARWVMPNLRGRAGAWRGTGSADYTLDAFAQDVVGVIREYVTTPHYVLAGWSMGVSVALATAVLLREKSLPLPQALVLMSGSPVLQQTSWFHASSHTDLMHEIAQREQRLGLREAADHDAVAWTWQAIRNSDQRHLLPALELPALILHGSADEDSPWTHAQLLEQGLPQARLCTIDGAQHSILTQNTGRVAEELRVFLSEHPTFRSHHEKQ